MGKMEDLVRQINPDFINGSRSLNNEGIIGYAYQISRQEWFKASFKPFDPERLGSPGNNWHRTRLMVLLYMSRHIVWRPNLKTDGPEGAAVFAYLVLNVFGKTLFSRLMSQYSKHKINWRVVKDSNSIESQIVTLRLRGDI